MTWVFLPLHRLAIGRFYTLQQYKSVTADVLIAKASVR